MVIIMNTEKIVQDILNELDIIVDEYGELVQLESIEFISMIVKLEETFNIEIPDDLLSFEFMTNIHDIATIINSIKENV